MALGEVIDLLAPNSLHHLFVKDWQQAFPNALSYAAEELAKRRVLHFDQLLFSELADSQHNAKAPWLTELDFCLFQGSPGMPTALSAVHSPGLGTLTINRHSSINQQDY